MEHLGLMVELFKPVVAYNVNVYIVFILGSMAVENLTPMCYHVTFVAILFRWPGKFISCCYTIVYLLLANCSMLMV